MVCYIILTVNSRKLQLTPMLASSPLLRSAFSSILLTQMPSNELPRQSFTPEEVLPHQHQEGYQGTRTEVLLVDWQIRPKLLCLKRRTAQKCLKKTIGLWRNWRLIERCTKINLNYQHPVKQGVGNLQDKSAWR